MTNMELREAVATKVMTLPDVVRVGVLSPQLFYTTSDPPHPVPAYESDISAAWQVVERMRTLGYCVTIEYGPGNNSVAWVTFSRPMPHSCGHARTVPLADAICRAALAAIERESK